MSKKIKNIFLTIIGILAIYLLSNYFKDYNLERTVSACIAGHKKTSKTFDLQKVKKICEDNIRKKTSNVK